MQKGLFITGAQWRLRRFWSILCIRYLEADYDVHQNFSILGPSYALTMIRFTEQLGQAPITPRFGHVLVVVTF